MISAKTFLIAAAALLTATFAPATAVSAETDTLRLSREECVAIGLQESPTVKVANLEVKRMDYSKKEVLANLFPTIDFTGAYQRSIELQSMRMSMGGQSQSIKMGTDNNWNFGFSAAMPLVNASLWKSIKLSDIQILQALEDSRASRLDLVDNINKAYYALLLAIDSREVIRQNYDLAVFNAGIFKKQFEQGTASEYDVLRSQVQVSNVEPELLQADISVKQCQLQLKVLMGIDNEVTVMPNITLSDMKREMYGYALEGDRSLARNTTLRSLDLSKDLASQNVNLQKMAWIPTLGAQFNINWNAMSNGNALKHQEFNPYSNVALALNVPIFSGGSKLQKLRQAQVQVAEIELQRENLVNSLNMQVDLAIDNINRQVKQIASSEQGMKQASKALEIMQKSFEIGAATYLDLRDSELANTSAQLAYLQSIYNYLVSTTELDTLLGREEALGITTTTNQAK
jgi:outer membrane protein TolC